MAMGVFTPITFAVSIMLMKHLTTDRMGFNSSDVTFSSTGFIQFFTLVVAISWYWTKIESLDWYLFLLGFIGSVTQSLGMSFINKAFTLGPSGTVSALGSVSAFFLVLIQAVKNLKSPRTLEIIGFIIGFIGALVLVIPDAFKCCFCKKR